MFKTGLKKGSFSVKKGKDSWQLAVGSLQFTVGSLQLENITRGGEKKLLGIFADHQLVITGKYHKNITFLSQPHSFLAVYS